MSNRNEYNVTIGSMLLILVFLFCYFWGMVLAKGAWMKVLVIVFCPYGFYLVVERIVTTYGLN